VQQGQISHQNVGHHQEGYWQQNRSYDFLLLKPDVHHLNYHVQSWSLCLKKDSVEVKKAQRRATKKIKEMEQLHK